MDPSIPEILIIKVLAREASAPEIAQVDAWLNASSENLKVFEEYKLIFKNQLSDHIFFDAGNAFEKIEPSLDKTNYRKYRFTYVSVAASLILLITLGVFYFNSNQAITKEEVAWQTLITGLRERKSFKLADGSVIYLNSESSIKWRKSFVNAPLREVFLEGEAFFEVAHDSLRPFIVKTAHISTKVLGTSFNINSINGIIKVSVASGSVSVKHPESETTLSPAQQFTYQLDNQKWWIDQIRPDDISAWRSGVLIFDNTRMDTAAIMLEKFYDANINFQDMPIKYCRITARFSDEPLLHVLEAIKEATGIDYAVDKGEVKLMGTQCK